MLLLEREVPANLLPVVQCLAAVLRLLRLLALLVQILLEGLAVELANLLEVFLPLIVVVPVRVDLALDEDALERLGALLEGLRALQRVRRPHLLLTGVYAIIPRQYVVA